MYLYIGNDVTIEDKEIIGIFDLEKTSVQKGINDYLSYCQKNGRIYYVSLDMPKSFVVCRDCVYITNVSAMTLKKRVKEGLKI